jgi:hypothetical protein
MWPHLGEPSEFCHASEQLDMDRAFACLARRRVRLIALRRFLTRFVRYDRLNR